MLRAEKRKKRNEKNIYCTVQIFIYESSLKDVCCLYCILFINI